MSKRIPEQKIDRCCECKYFRPDEDWAPGRCEHPEKDSLYIDACLDIDDECPLGDYNIPMLAVDARPRLFEFVDGNRIKCNDDFDRVDPGEYFDLVHDLLRLFGYDHLYPMMEDF